MNNRRLIAESDVRKVIREELVRSVIHQQVMLDEGFLDALKGAFQTAKAAASVGGQTARAVGAGARAAAGAASQHVAQQVGSAAGKVTGAVGKGVKAVKAKVGKQVHADMTTELRTVISKTLKRAKEVAMKYLGDDEETAKAVALGVVIDALENFVE